MNTAHLIGGQWTSDGADLAADENPSDLSDVVGHFPAAHEDVMFRGVDAAREAQAGWAAAGIVERHDLLQRTSEILMARRDAIAETLAREEGKTRAEAVGEVLRAAQVFSFFAGECLRVTGDKLESLRLGVEVEVVREPMGVIGMITPWNFPIAIPAWKIAPALAYGNTVVLKPAELVPATATLLIEAILDAGAPPGVVNLVLGSGARVGQALVQNVGIDAVSFTGSVATGRRIAATSVAANPMKKLQLEMGGKNPLVVLDDADIDLAADAAVNGAFFSTGQRCTASSRLIVTDAVHDRFVAAVTERAIALRVGHALDPATDIGPVVDARQLQQNLAYVEIGRAEGAQLRFGGERLSRDTNGFYFSPALFTDVTNDMRIAREEIFGPVASVIRVRDYEEALSVANDTEFGLSAGICTGSLKYATHFRRNSKAGMVMVNLPTAGVDYHAPFGGRRGSSYGQREQGRYAAEFYTTVKTSYVRA